MSLDARNMTQGGQVIKYMINMFLQITNIVSYWAVLAGLSAFLGYLVFATKWIYLKHGLFFYYIKWIVAGFGKINGDGNLANNKTIYSFSWENSAGKIVEFKRTAGQILQDEYFLRCAELLKENAMVAWGVGLVAFLGVMLIVFKYLGSKGAAQRKNEIMGGRYLAKSVKEVNQFLKDNNKKSDLKIGDLHMVKDSEQQNIALHGTVGTGKSTIINSFLEQVRKRNQRAAIYDKGNNFIPLFYRDGKDVILNPLDIRCPNWDLWLECLDRSDFETFALPLVPEGKGDPFWVMSARKLFVATAEKMRSDPERSIRKLLDNLVSISLEDLQEYVKNTDASSLVSGSIEKTAMTIRGVLGAYVNALRYCEHLGDGKGKPFSIREWVHNADQDAWIFISSDGRLHASLKPLISTWLNIAMQSILALNRSRERRIWTMLDELASLHELPILPEYMAESRKFGGVTLIGVQNFAQLEDAFGVQKARSIWDLCNTTVYFRAPSGYISEWVQKELGEIHHLKFQDQYSYGVDAIRDGVNFSKPDTREMIVSYSDIQNLNDLECYVSLLGDVPIVKVSLKYKDYPVIAEGKIEHTSFDYSKIEKEDEKFEDEFIDNVLNKKDKPDGTKNKNTHQANTGSEAEIKPPVQIKDTPVNTGEENHSPVRENEKDNELNKNEPNIIRHKKIELDDDLGLL